MTADPIDPRFDVLHALKVKGLAGDEVLAAISGLADTEVTSTVDSLVEDGFALRRDAGRMSGTMITPAGRDEYDRLAVAVPRSNEVDDALAAFYDAFGPINTDFKTVCTAWQVRPDGGANDHDDETYDASVVADLTDIDARVGVALDTVSAAVPRLGRYRARLQSALARVRGGDKAAFARPMYDSYHDVWMELHQDLILTAGRERGAGDE